MNFRPWRLVFFCTWILAIQCWAGEPLLVVPEKTQVDITTGFAGTEFKAVGVIDGAGDLIIKVVGPQQEVTLSRETKLGPFWVGGDAVKVGAPSVLLLHATRPIASLLPRSEQERYGLLLEGVPVRIEPRLQAHAAGDWRGAFFRLKEQRGYYREDDHAIRIFGNRLFIAELPLPRDLEIGTYRIETLLVKSGRVVGRDVARFTVRLAGVEHWVWNAAHEHAWVFGVLLTLAAMALGVLLNAVSYRQAARS